MKLYESLCEGTKFYWNTSSKDHFYLNYFNDLVFKTYACGYPKMPNTIYMDIENELSEFPVDDPQYMTLYFYALSIMNTMLENLS